MTDSDKLALDLDQIIRLGKTTNRRGGGANRGGRGRTGRGGNNFSTRGGGGFPRASNAPAGGRWKHDLFNNNSNQNRGAQRNSGVNSTAKLLISNLDFGVTTSDIQELFEDIGAVRVARVHYDENGQSLGTAEVVYERRVDAVNAQQKYNSVNLDGRAMDIRIVGGVDDGARAQSSRGFANGGGRNQRLGGNRNNNTYNNNNQQNGGRGNRVRGGKQQNGTSGKKEEVTVDDLDADLEAYRAESKQQK